MIGIEQETIATHHKLNDLYLDLEIRLTLEDNFTFFEEVEYLVRKRFNKDLTNLYKKVLKRLSNKDGIVELNPKIDGKLHEFYRTVSSIYKNEYMRFNFKWDANKNLTQGDIPFLISTKQNSILGKLKEDKDLVMNTMKNAVSVEDFVNKMNVKNTNIELSKMAS